MRLLTAQRNVARALALCLLMAPSALAAQDMGASAAVDRLSFSASALTGEQGSHDNTMAIGSATFPVTSRASAQLDFGVGSYRHDYASYVAGARMFRRYGSSGGLGLYLDYANISPEHVGRFGLEGSYHLDRVSFDALVGFRTGTNVYTTGFDEIDVTYYFGDNLKGSVGHRGTSRGNVANVAFEYAPNALGGWTVFGEAEFGEDENHSAFAGMRYTLGGGRYPSLIERDRKGPMRVRVPRNIVDVTRCGHLPEKQSATFGLREMSVLCASEDELEDEGATEEKKG